ncbi:MAG: hypothetical protein GF383_03065 [Candidatus Lokiarchaeota archaeon]|nr:hypothetical protein [Candidatus Lokiarchaeota archaeon]MBD3338520.1 hypothetical protein [Candidatus Lokiarchaeota archaeon]
MDKRIPGRKNYPTKEIDPDNFIEDDKVREMVKNVENLKLNSEDFYKIYNCVDCGECSTEEERILLKHEYLNQGNTFDGWEEMVENFENYRTPYPTKKMRITVPEGVKGDSDTLVFMGCLSTIRIPKYTEHALEYLVKNDIDFTVLDEEVCCGWPWFVSGSIKEIETCKKENLEILTNYKKIICLCPACFYLYKNNYQPELEDVKIDYVVDYLKPSKEKKSGNVAFQHLCQLINRGKENTDKFVESIFEKSGYNVIDVPHWCCGGGIGYMHRTDIIDAVAKKRMEDFNKEEIDYVTTYCVSCWWILRRFSKQCHIKPKAIDVFELLL